MSGVISSRRSLAMCEHLIVPLSALSLLIAITGTTRAQCALSPINDVPLDAELGEPLLYGGYGGPLGIFNLYWDDNWDADPANFRKADIEAALGAVLATPYFDRLCQYGVNGFFFEGGTESSSSCGRDPGPATTVPGIFSFMSCEEYTPFTNVPIAVGAPNPLTCVSCGLAPVDCFNVLDPLGAAACLATPNPTGSRVYVLFLPKGTVINDFGSVSCTDYEALHFQIPSRALFNIIPPFITPLTQGRPINIAIIPTQCATDLAELMHLVTHEIVEAATDPLPLAHWIDNSTAGGFDLGDIGTLLKEGEISDICGTTTRFTTPEGLPIAVADYWSNFDNACVSVDVLPPITTAALAPPSVWANTNVTVTLTASDRPVATGSGVAEVVFSATGAEPIAETHVAGASAALALAAEGVTVVTFFASDNAGNVESPRTAVVRIDRTAPSIVASAAPPANLAGWNHTDVIISFACNDALSGIAACSGPVVLTAEGTDQGASGSSSDRAGNASSTSLTGIAIDKTPPVIAYAGNAGSYSIDLMIDITCSTSDNLSGVVDDTCEDVHLPAWSLALGEHTLSAEAIDAADNLGTGATSFDVFVTEESLCNLSRAFSGNPGVANGLCDKLAAMASATTANAREGQRTAYLNQLAAQTGRALTADEAEVLRSLVLTL